VGSSCRVDLCVFFSTERWILRLFPRFRPLEMDAFFFQDCSQGLQTDLAHNIDPQDVFLQLLQRPVRERAPEQLRRRESDLDNIGPDLGHELDRPTAPSPFLEQGDPFDVESANELSDVLFVQASHFGYLLNRIAVCGVQYHLSASERRSALATPQDTLDVLPFRYCQRTNK